MKERSQIEEEIYLLVRAVRSVALKRAITEIEPNSGLNFWRMIQGDSLDIALLEWCKVFGVDSEHSHWKHFVTNHAEFRTGLFKSAGVDADGWREHWEQVTTYRNELVAHNLDDRASTHFPSLELVLKSCFYFFQHLIGMLDALEDGGNSYHASLADYHDRLFAQNVQIAKAAIEATKSFEEKVH